MKKNIFIAFLLTLAFLSSNAQDFRGCKGFIDFFGGLCLGDMGAPYSTGSSTITVLEPRISFGMNVTGGYQITNYLFAGVGFGGYTVMDRYAEGYSYGDADNYFPAIMLPVFADCRWTLNINRKITPFVDLKIGYQFRCSLEDGNITYYSQNNLYLSQEAGFYCQPTIGVRFGKASAFNFGFTFNPTICQKISEGKKKEDRITLIQKCSQTSIMVSLGADF